MNIDITKLKSGYESEIEIEDVIEFDKEQIKKAGMIDLEKVSVKGYMERTYEGYYLDILIESAMILPCALTLEEVRCPFHIKIEQDLKEDIENIEKSYKICENSIDISQIIWENIVMEIPIKVVSPKADKVRKEGPGWRLLDEDEECKHSPFENIEDLLK